MPVAKHAVQLLQVVQRRFGGRQYIAPVVSEHVLFQLKVLAGGGHELPHASGLGAGHGLGVERALNEGQQRQLGGHVAPLQLFNNVKHVLAGALGHAQHVVRAAAVPRFPVADQVIAQVGHAVAGADAFPQVGWRRQGHHAARSQLGRRDGLKVAAGDEGLRVGVEPARGRGLGGGRVRRVAGVGEACGGTARQPEQAGGAQNFE